MKLCSISSLAVLLLAACGGGDGESLPGDDNVGGQVISANGPVAGATITILPNGATATADDNGKFSIEAPTGVVDFLIEAPGHWGLVRRAEIFPDDIVTGAEVELTTDAEVAEAATALSRAISEDAGAMVAYFTSDGVDLAGASAEIYDANIEPVTTDPPFTFDDNDEPVASAAVLGGTFEVPLVFTGIAVGAYEIFPLQTDTLGCAPEFGMANNLLPVRAKTLSTMNIYCGAIE